MWVYQANRSFSDREVEELRPQVKDFAARWVAHGKDLLSWGDVLHHHFIVLMVDETRQPASGCSIDTSTRFIADLEQRYGVSLFDRLSVALWLNEQVKLVSRNELLALLDSESISRDTLMFDNTVRTKADFDARWIAPITATWAARWLRLQPAQ